MSVPNAHTKSTVSQIEPSTSIYSSLHYYLLQKRASATKKEFNNCDSKINGRLRYASVSGKIWKLARHEPASSDAAVNVNKLSDFWANIEDAPVRFLWGITWSLKIKKYTIHY